MPENKYTILCFKGPNRNEHFRLDTLPDKFIPNSGPVASIFPNILRGVYTPTGEKENDCYIYKLDRYAGYT